MIIRPVQRSDLSALYHLAKCAGTRLTTLPVDGNFLSERIEQACKTFEYRCACSDADYLFVMVNDAGDVIGVTGIAGEVGVVELWYTYHVKTLERRSDALGVTVKHQTLNLSDNEESTELCSLFLHPDYRGGSMVVCFRNPGFCFWQSFVTCFVIA